MIIISKNGDGDFKKIQDAIDSIPNNINKHSIIFIKDGIYKEKIFIDNKKVKLIGQSRENTIITYDDYAYKIMDDGSKMGTFRSYTLFVGSDNFYAENLTIENSSGDGELVGQAIAAYIDSNHAKFRNCNFIGCQDTLFLGPLPPQPRIPNSFVGPREFHPRNPNIQYFDGCRIQGDIDFIFGSSMALFTNCDIVSNNRNKTINGFITAASTPKDSPFGFIFYRCNLISDAAKESVYLGRPWRQYAKVSFIECNIGEHITSEGWDLWGNEKNKETVRFEEINNYGKNYSTINRPSYVHCR